MELSDFHEIFYVQNVWIRFKRKVVDSLWQTRWVQSCKLNINIQNLEHWWEIFPWHKKFADWLPEEKTIVFIKRMSTTLNILVFQVNVIERCVVALRMEKFRYDIYLTCKLFSAIPAWQKLFPLSWDSFQHIWLFYNKFFVILFTYFNLNFEFKSLF